MKYVQVPETPEGQRYVVVAAPPRSLLDAGAGSPRGGLVGGVMAMTTALLRAGRRQWRIAVTPCDARGRPTGPTHRERVADQAAAEARAEALVTAIVTGDWPQAGSATKG